MKVLQKHFKIILSDKNGKHLFVPRGFAHGILGLDKENILHYACTNYRDPKNHRSKAKSRGILLRKFLTENISNNDLLSSSYIFNTIFDKKFTRIIKILPI